MPSGLREITITDELLGLTFPALVQYPAVAKGLPAQIGPYTFESARNAELAEGEFPLAVISHGSGGSHLLYRNIGSHLAQHGYVVVAPEHPGNNRNNNELQGTDENSVRRPRHASLAIDAVIADPFFRNQIKASSVAGVGHSQGACTILALAGGQPWSRSGKPLPVQPDQRIGTAVLLAPATEWYAPLDSLREVTVPILLLAGEKDQITPLWHSEIVLDRLPDRRLAKLQVIENAGHFSFLSPFPPEMCRPAFLPATDPLGFDRERFHLELPRMILAFLEENAKI
ncbi:MAG: alpha/beta fold hydrolase [Desulfobulbaceae bacterium]|nr:alpha/beta fold hydrolase [Desulfobulbaceae bacterium]